MNQPSPIQALLLAGAITAAPFAPAGAQSFHESQQQVQEIAFTSCAASMSESFAPEALYGTCDSLSTSVGNGTRNIHWRTRYQDGSAAHVSYVLENDLNSTTRLSGLAVRTDNGNRYALVKQDHRHSAMLNFCRVESKELTCMAIVDNPDGTPFLFTHTATLR